MKSKLALAKALYSAEQDFATALKTFLQVIHPVHGVSQTDLETLKKMFFRAFLKAALWGRLTFAQNVIKLSEDDLDEQEAEFESEERREAKKTAIELLRKYAFLLPAFLGRQPVDETMLIRQMIPPAEVLDFFKHYTVRLANIESEAILRDVTQFVEETIRSGMSERQAIEYLATKLPDLEKKRIVAIARTEATRAFNAGLISASLKYVKAYKFSAVLDDRTTEICRSRHGMYIPADDLELLIRNTPPLHVNCRSTLIPEFEIAGPILDERLVPAAKKRDVDIFDLTEFLRRLR